MICPKCTWDQPDAATCARCGVLVARYRAMAAFAQKSAPAPAPAPHRGTPEAPAARSFMGLLEWTGMGVAVLCLGLWMMRKTPPPEAPPPPAPEAVALPPARTPSPAGDPGLMAQAQPQATAVPAAPDEVMPSGRCPLLDHGLAGEPYAPRVSSSWYTRGDDFAHAMQEMEDAMAPTFVYVHTDWCQYCKAFEQGLLSSGVVSAYLDESAVKMKINPESGPAEERVAQTLGVSGYPTVLLLLPSHGSVRLSLYKRDGDKKEMRSPEEFVANIKELVRGQAGLLVSRASAQTRPEKKIADYTKALRLSPGDPDIYYARGMARVDSAQVDDALDDFAHVATLTPKDPRPYPPTQMMLDSQKRTEEGIACWTGFIEANPNSGAGYWGRAQALKTDNLPGLSAKDAQKACQLGQRDACGQYSLGVVTGASR